MPENSSARPALHCALARFPGKERLARRLFLMNPTFRSVCEDYRLAREGLVTFEQLAATEPRAELLEYRTLVEELEAELLRMLAGAEPDEAGQAPERGH